jgi:hypothetical protein
MGCNESRSIGEVVYDTGITIGSGRHNRIMNRDQLLMKLLRCPPITLQYSMMNMEITHLPSEYPTRYEKCCW